MKKCLALLFVLLLIPVVVYAGEGLIEVATVNYPIFINGDKMESDLPILNHEGNTYIPLRKVTEEMGYNVDWDNDKRVVELNEEKSIDTAFEEFRDAISEKISINGKLYHMDTKIKSNEFSQGDFTDLYVNGLTIYLYEDNGESFNQSIIVKKAWVEKDNKLVEINFEEQGSVIEDSDGTIKYKIHNVDFPFNTLDAYNSNSFVDVYVKLFDKENQEYYLIKASDQEVVVIS